MQKSEYVEEVPKQEEDEVFDIDNMAEGQLDMEDMKLKQRLEEEEMLSHMIE